MAMGQLDDHWAYKQESIDHFTERARGGTGLIITGANFIENRIEKHRKASFPCPLEDPQSYMTQLKKMSDNIPVSYTHLVPVYSPCRLQSAGQRQPEMKIRNPWQSM